MRTKVVKLDAERIDPAKIKQAAALVDAGSLVAFPTETVYGIACKVRPESLTKLNNLKTRAPDKPYTLHIGQTAEVEKYLPTIGLKAEKLIKNAWPGPLTIVFELAAEDIDRQRNSLETAVFEGLYKDNTIGIRCPDNPIASMLLRLAHSPVVAPSANITGQAPAVNADRVLAQFAGQIELVLDAGPCKYEKSSTIVKIGKRGLQILRPGVYSNQELEALSQVKFLFICTGNTCRSPMAAAIFSKYWAEKLGCEVDRLEKKGYKVFSAGIMDMAGLPASPEAIATCAVRGIDIKTHESVTLSRQLVEECDFIFAMCQMHREHVTALSSEAADKCVLLAENDISDPIGRGQQVYDQCAELIEKAVKKRIDELVI